MTEIEVLQFDICRLWAARDGGLQFHCGLCDLCPEGCPKYKKPYDKRRLEYCSDFVPFFDENDEKFIEWRVFYEKD